MNASQPTPNLTRDAYVAGLEAELLGFLARRVGPEAEELAQDLWLKVAAAAPECADEASFRAYVYVVARRMLIDRYRRGRLVHLPLSGQEPGAAGPESEVAAGELAALVERALAAERPELAEVFWLRARDGVAFAEIAAQQGCSVNTALGRMHQVVQRLRRLLAAEGW